MVPALRGNGSRKSKSRNGSSNVRHLWSLPGFATRTPESLIYAVSPGWWEDFRNCDLHGAILSGCDLTGANFEGADLRDADFLALETYVRESTEDGVTIWSV